MSGFWIGIDKKELLQQEMARSGIHQIDIIEKFVRSSGQGGQNVNKVSTCVYLRHIPTGIEVKCQRERSQALNRYIARQLLIKKIRGFRLAELSRQRQLIEKIRRQKRTRSKKSKLRILEEKRRHAQKKLLRSRPRQIEE